MKIGKLKLPKKLTVKGLVALVRIGAVTGSAKIPAAAPVFMAVEKYLSSLVKEKGTK